MNITPNMSWIKKLAFLAIIWAVAIALLLAGTEVFLRATDGGWGRTLRLNLVRSRSYDFPVSGLYPWKSPTVHYVRDKYGLRDDCASPADIDILTVGGSTTDQRYLSQESTYQAVMEKALTHAAGQQVCVGNAGVDGQSTYGHLRSFRDWFPLIPGLRPKLFLFYIGINDADFTRSGPDDSDDREPHRLKRLEVVQLGLWVRDAVNSALGDRPGQTGHSRVDWRTAEYPQVWLAADTPERAARNAAGFRQRLRQLLRLARARGADVLCVTQPHRMAWSVDGRRRGIAGAFGGRAGDAAYGGLDYDYSLQQLNRVMRDECGERRLVDLYGTNFDDGDFYDYVHMTPSGARKVGTRIAAFIAQSDVMDELRTGSAR
jgi:lysophospholipase L1-like esterase